ncbi:MAG: hypothetical protein ABIY37_07040 [Devosia sp.]
MPTTLHQIDSRSKFNEMYYALPGDFTRASGVPVDARRVIDEPGWSPYCLDPENDALTFVRLPPEIDLSGASFYYVTQYREANAVIDMPFDEAIALAATLPNPEIALIFSIGRCGTTLVNHALNRSAEVVSLSEPEVFAHGAFRALPATVDRLALIDAVCRLLFAARSDRDARLLAIKFRSQALFIGEDIFRALPRAKYVFMYRDAVTWSESMLQFVLDVGIPLPMNRQNRDFSWMMISADTPIAELGRYIDLDQDLTEADVGIPPGWSVQSEQYRKLLDAGVPFLALRYNELVRNREAELTRLFTHCGVPLDSVAKALSAFDEDSQKGTLIERKGEKRRFDAAGIANIRSTLAKNPAFADPDLILPDFYSR